MQTVSVPPTQRPPRPPPGSPLSDVAKWLAACNEGHARRDRIVLSPARAPVPTANLASTIAKDNEERRARTVEREQRDNARQEIMLTCDLVARDIQQGRGSPEVLALFVGA